jgi:hypothetical protein
MMNQTIFGLNFYPKTLTIFYGSILSLKIEIGITIYYLEGFCLG